MSKVSPILVKPQAAVEILVPKVPVRLTPISWGKRDRPLGEAVCAHIMETMPATMIPWNPHQTVPDPVRKIKATSKSSLLVIVLIAVAAGGFAVGLSKGSTKQEQIQHVDLNP